MDAYIDISSICLETERLILRPWTKEDLDDFYEYASVDGVGEMAGWSHHETKSESEAILKRFIEGKKTFALVLKRNQKVIGSLGLESVQNHEKDDLKPLYGREIGYVLSKDYWNQGLMSEAVKEVIRWCFDDLKLDYLLCGNFVDNIASACVQKKNGFVPYRTIEYFTSSQEMKISQMNVLFKGERK